MIQTTQPYPVGWLGDAHYGPWGYDPTSKADYHDWCADMHVQQFAYGHWPASSHDCATAVTALHDATIASFERSLERGRVTA